jgi:hypothetical protein
MHANQEIIKLTWTWNIKNIFFPNIFFQYISFFKFHLFIVENMKLKGMHRFEVLQ